MTIRKIPARYIGQHAVGLNPAMGPYFYADGTRKTDLTLSTGEVILMPETEVLGQTFLRDSNDNLLYLGAGKCRLPEHVGLSDEELTQSGFLYEHHMGRSDFIPLEVEAQPQTTMPDATSATSGESYEEEAG